MEDFIFGTRAVLEAISAGKDIERVLLQKKSESAGAQELFSVLRQKNIEFQFVPVEKLNRVTRKNHQGVIAYLSQVSYTPLEEMVSRAYESGKDPFILVLDHISDVRNFGAIARTAECAGVDGIVIPEKGSVRVTADAVKTSAGALMKIPVARVGSLRVTINYLAMSGLSIVSATEKSETGLYEAELGGPIALIMGSEEIGVSASLLELSNKRVKIPMLGEIGSLNVSVAAGVVIYEVIRQRSKSMEAAG
jgi:23S rRNA (guanosine2251-2'-O)-methyltransferase